MKLSTSMTLNRITDEVWEIPASEKAGMLVPARIYATEQILSTMDSGVFERVTKGARWCIDQGYGWHEDLSRIEEQGCIPGADPSKVSDRAVERGISQLGTLGSGNHYLEVQVASNDRIFDPQTAAALGITGHDQI